MHEELLRLARETTQREFHALCETQIRTGTWDQVQWARYAAAEVLQSAAEDYARRVAHEIAEFPEPFDDGDRPDVPGVFVNAWPQGWAESEMRFDNGDR